MGCFACSACGQQILEKDCGCSQKVRDRVDALEEQVRNLQSKIDNMQNAVYVILDNIAQREIVTGAKEAESFKVTKEALEQLWAATDLNWSEEKSVDCFLSRQLIEGWVTLDAMELFRKNARRRITRAGETISWRSRLDNLRNSLIALHDFHGWSKNSFALDANEVLWEMSQEV